MAWENLAPQVIKRLSTDLSLTPQQAAGIVGQLGYESEGLQAINERKPVVPGSRGGFGWAQWTGPRRRQFESWAGENKMDINTPEANYGFLVHELTNTPESRALEQIRKAEDAQSAGRLFTDNFLRPGIPAHDKRATWTDQALNFIMPAAQAGTLQEGQPAAQQSGIADRIKQARDAGFADEEILRRIQGNAAMSARIQKARDAGFTDEEIYGRMGLSPSAQVSTDGKGDAVRWGEEQPSVAERIGNGIMETGRQVGLTGRYALEGLGQAAGVLTEPIRQGLNVGLRAAGLPEAAPTAQVASMAADTVGLPQPENPNERVVGDVTRLMAGAGGIAGGSRALAQGATGLTQAALNAMGANPAQQVISAAGAGGAGGAVRESGGGPMAQAAAGLVGGLAAPMAASGVQRMGQALQGRISSMAPNQVLERVQGALRQSGVEYNQLPARVQQQLQQEAAQALRSGRDLDPAALRRLADFARIEGATPTRGMLTQDPNQVTREMNLAKLQANTQGGGLAQVQADNNAALVRALNTMGAGSADDAVASGQRAIGALENRIGAQKSRVNSLYSQARDNAGRSAPLDHRAFADSAIKALDDQLVGGSLPADVRNHLNRISAGEVPFTVDYAEQLKTMIGRLQRGSSDGSARYALGLVRQALDDTPILPLGNQPAAAGARAVNPGGLPSVPGSTQLGDEAVSAFNQARSANRSMMRQIERTPALKQLYDGSIAPEQFAQKFVIGSSAKVGDVQRLGRMLAADPSAKDAVKISITQHLKDKALSGAPDDIGSAKFSPGQYAKALASLGDRKLGAFFDAEEIAQLHAISRAGRLMVNQPVGSAVNNSNTAAATIGRVLDMMGSAGKGFKLFGVGDQIGAIQSGLQQRSAQQVAPALSAPAMQIERGQRLAPAALYGSLLAAPGVPRGQDDRRP